jgi:hypothetical protein
VVVLPDADIGRNQDAFKGDSPVRMIGVHGIRSARFRGAETKPCTRLPLRPLAFVGDQAGHSRCFPVGTGISDFARKVMRFLLRTEDASHSVPTPSEISYISRYWPMSGSLPARFSPDYAGRLHIPFRAGVFAA